MIRQIKPAKFVGYRKFIFNCEATVVDEVFGKLKATVGLGGSPTENHCDLIQLNTFMTSRMTLAMLKFVMRTMLNF